MTAKPAVHQPPGLVAAWKRRGLGGRLRSSREEEALGQPCDRVFEKYANGEEISCARQRIIHFRLGYTCLCSMQHLGRPAARCSTAAALVRTRNSELCQHCSDAPNVSFYPWDVGIRATKIIILRNQKLKSFFDPFPKSGLSHSLLGIMAPGMLRIGS